MPSWINKVKDALHLNRGNKRIKNKPKANASYDENLPSNSIRSSKAHGIFLGLNPSDSEGCSVAAPGECSSCAGRFQIPTPETYTSAEIGIGVPYLTSREWNDTNSYDSSPTNRLDLRVDSASINPYEILHASFEVVSNLKPKKVN
ncbi:hypothetical protein OnM2_049020 [Erysiphe neolycopersici]|uniref:Uncharacterized protein n=1 Tax=Erysiphe neolycopersici TaxID=212602 RepID=A0A420HSZ1_9PEZI|nr:hypothetical protein OnM2_049020 [Erysiphe neolycopersici]